MKRAPRLAAAVGLGASAALGLGCWSSTNAELGLDEPIRVKQGTFVPGPLPGSPPPGPSETDAGAAEATPHLTTINTLTTRVRPGQPGLGLTGGVTDDAEAVAVRFTDIGSGYWVVPASGPDPSKPGELTWSLSFDVSPDAPSGPHPLGFAAIDKRGGAGPQTALDFCIDSATPDNFNACDPTKKPPFAVLSLTWDTEVDLDLQLVTPQGKLVDPKHPTTAVEVDGGPVFDPSVDGSLDRDSNKNCFIDGLRREDLAFPSHPRNGQYLVYVNLASACGQSAVRFKVVLSLATQHGNRYSLDPALHAEGELVAQDQNGGDALGLFVTQFSFE